jgi:hypothetical protein
MSTVPKSDTELTIDHVDEERGAEILDREARQYLNMSGPEFVRRYKSCQLQEFDHEEVFRVAILLPLVGESLGGGKQP